MTDATTNGSFPLTGSDHRNNETKKRVRGTSLDTSSNSETSSIKNNKRICYEGCADIDSITGLLSLDNINNGTINININSEINSNNNSNSSSSSNINAATHNSHFDLPIPNPLASPVSPVVEGQQQHSLVFPSAAGFASNNDHHHAEATAGVEEVIAEVEEALFGTIDHTAVPTSTVTTTTKKLFLCQRPLCAKPYIRAVTEAGVANDALSSSLLRQTTATATAAATGVSAHAAAMISRAIAPAVPVPVPRPVPVPVQSQIKSSSLPNTILTTTTTTTPHTTAPISPPPPPPLPAATMSSVIAPSAPVPANPSPAVSVSTSFVPYRTYAYQQVSVPVIDHTLQQGTTSGTKDIASAIVLPAAATACININSATTYRNPTTQQRLTLWKQQQLIQQQQQQVQRLAQQQQQLVQQLAQQQQRTQQQTPQGRRLCTVQQQQQQRRQQYQRQQQGIYYMDDEAYPSQSHIRTAGTRSTRRCPLSRPPRLPTTILK